MKSPLVLIAIDLASTPGRLIPVERDHPDGWLAGLSLTVDVPPSGTPGRATVALALRDAAAFAPKSVAAALASAGTGPDSPGLDRPEMDRVLQNPRFQRIESAWRGVSFLCAHAAGEAKIEILATSRKDLVRDLEELVAAPARTGLRDTPTLILLDVDFSHQQQDLADLAALGELAADLHAPIVAGTSPAIFGLRHFAHLVAFPDPLGALQAPALAPWRAFQASDPARWICLTLGRYLQRAPYELETPPYREKVEEARPESFLWGRGIWLIGAAALRSLGKHGHPLDLSGQGGMFKDLPSRAYPKSANEGVALSTEAPLPEMRASELAWAGFTPLAGVLRAGTVVLPMVVTCSRLSPGRLTLEGTLAYQLLAAKLAAGLESALSAGPLVADEAEARLRTALMECLGPLAGNDPDATLKIEVVPPGEETGARPVARIHVAPALHLEGRQPEFDFEVPLRVA